MRPPPMVSDEEEPDPLARINEVIERAPPEFSARAGEAEALFCRVHI